MRFYVEFLGFDDNVRIKEIYPTSNSFDIGISDLYTMEPRYDNITFQCDFDQNIFKYYPSTNNTCYKVYRVYRYNVDDTTYKMDAEPGIVDGYYWLESERVYISEDTESQPNITRYNMTRGVNNSIAVTHSIQYNAVTYQTTTLMTEKKLTPINTICRFFTTDNIGGEPSTLAYGIINTVTLSNSKLVTVTCEHLYKQVENPIKIQSNYMYDRVRFDDTIGREASPVVYREIDGKQMPYIFASSIFRLSYVVESPDVSLVHRVERITNEFVALFDMPEDFAYNCEIPLTEVQDDDVGTMYVLTMKDYFKFILNLNNAIVTINKTTGRYTLTPLNIPTVLENEPEEVFLSNYFNVKNHSVSVSTFEKISNIKINFHERYYDITSPANTVTLKETFAGYVDNIISSVSSKSVEMDCGKILLNTTNSTSLMNDENFIYTRNFPLRTPASDPSWVYLVYNPSTFYFSRAYPRIPTKIHMDYASEFYSLKFDEVISLNTMGSMARNRMHYLNLCTDVVEVTSSQWYRRFVVGGRYIFSDNHLIKTMSDVGFQPIWTCIGYEGDTVRFISSEDWKRYYVSFYSHIVWNTTISKWVIDVPRYVKEDILYPTLADGDELHVYSFNLLDPTQMVTWSNQPITLVEWDSNISKYTFTFSLPYIVPDDEYMRCVTYKVPGPTGPTGRYSIFLYEDYGQV